VKNLHKRLNVILPWGKLAVGQTFFVPGANETLDADAIKQSARRNNMTASVHPETRDGKGGLLVRRLDNG